MATITPTVTEKDDGAVVVHYPAMAAADTITAYVPPVGRTLHGVNMYGTFGGTATLSVGADGTNYAIAEDTASIAVSATAVAFFNMGGLKMPYFLPTAGTGVTAAQMDLVFY